MLLVLAAVAAGLIFLQFRGDFTPRTDLTLLSPRAGLVVDPGSKVTYNGVEIGRVARIGTVDVDGTPKAKLTLDVDPRLSGLHPGQRGRRYPGHHRVRQQVRLVQFTGKSCPHNVFRART